MALAGLLREEAIRKNKRGDIYAPGHAPKYATTTAEQKWGRIFIQTAITLPIYETAQKYEGPALIIHGMDDRVVPYTYGERFHQVMKNSEIILIPGENHGFGTNLPYAASMASEWLVKNLKAQ